MNSNFHTNKIQFIIFDILPSMFLIIVFSVCYRITVETGLSCQSDRIGHNVELLWPVTVIEHQDVEVLWPGTVSVAPQTSLPPH